MTVLVLYGLANCDTCKKALKALEDAGRQVTFVNIRGEADLDRKLPAWLAAAGSERLVNKRSTTWRALSPAEQALAVDGNAVDLLIAHPTLIKRPVIERGAEVFVGWSKDVASVLT
ncbi:MAG: ArsC family transcriptional regulator [Alphaproteobacteria bacterium]|nr:ArsC family transcriptional regulator [Alphaproteobacteria bacterium]